MIDQSILKRATAFELMKAYQLSTPNVVPDMGAVFSRMVREKGWSHEAIIRLAREGKLGFLFSSFVIRNFNNEQVTKKQSIYDYLGETVRGQKPAACQAYRGLPSQNKEIDQAISTSLVVHENNFFGNGIAGRMSTFPVLGLDFSNVPVAVIGGGLAGTIAVYSLKRMGFKNITLYEKGQRHGIWSREDVYRGSRNNPRVLVLGDLSLAKAPGDGSEVLFFSQNIGSVAVGTVTSDVTSILPSPLKTTVLSRGRTAAEYPIVINCLGLGRPLPPSDSKRMVTRTSNTDSGIRWQKILAHEEIRRHKFIFIGLGNSTAEMLRQIHSAQDSGVDVDYHVLTHYPKDAVFNPDETVEKRGTKYRVFRDLSASNLVDYQGDLPLSRHDYYRALKTDRIISDVTRWERLGLTLEVFQGKSHQEIPFTSLYTLIGYGQRPADLVNFGCAFKADVMQYDYDGELQKTPGKTDPDERLHKGYFGFGALLATPDNPNAIVIPGMLHRLGDLLFGVVMRALEYQNNPK